MDRRRGVLAVFGGCLAITWPGALVFGFPGVMAGYWQQSLGVGRGALGAILFFMLAAVGSFMFLVGRWQARLGLRRMALAGVGLCAASLLWAAWVPGLAAVYVWAFLAGASSCLVYLPALTAAQLWWPEHRGLASGTVNMAFAASAALLSPLLSRLLATAGYAAANLSVAALALFFGGLASLLIVPPDAAASGEAAAREQLAPSTGPAEALRTKSFWFLWATWALQGAAGVSMITLSAAVARGKGFTAGQAVSLLVAFNLASGGSRLVMGFLSDRIGRNLSLSATSAAAGAAYLALPHVHGVGTSAVLAALVGFAFGTLFSVSGPLVMECFGPLHFGAVYGLVFTAYGFLAGVIGPWLSGVVLDANGGSLAGPCLYLGLFCLAASLLVLRVRPVRPHPA